MYRFYLISPFVYSHALSQLGVNSTDSLFLDFFRYLSTASVFSITILLNQFDI